jgi:shikimate kinase
MPSEEDPPRRDEMQGPRVVVVGPDAAGKSTLVERLRARRYNARSCGQDHSHVPDMWQIIAQPDFLIYVDAELETIAQRRNISWGRPWLDELHRRLAHARAHADLYLPTDGLTPEQVAERAVRALESADIRPGERG